MTPRATTVLGGLLVILCIASCSAAPSAEGAAPRPAPSRPDETAAGGSGRTTAAEAIALMTPLGFRQAGEPEAVLLERGARLARPFAALAGRCYVFAALGGPGIERLPLRLEGSAGLLARDGGRRPEGWVRHCSEADEQLRLTIAGATGAGEVVLVVFSAWRAEVRELVGPPLDARPLPRSLESTIRSVDEVMSRRGYRAGERLGGDALEAGDRLNARLRLSEGECAAIQALSEPGLTDLDLEVADASGRIVVADRDPGAQPFVGVCSPGPVRYYTVAAVILRGAGEVALRVHRLPDGGPDDLTHPVMRYAAREAAAIAGAGGLGGAHRTIELRQGADSQVWDGAVELGAERCHAVAVIAPQPIELLLLTVPGTGDERRWEGPGLPGIIALCPERDAEAAVRVRLADLPERAAPEPLLIVFEDRAPRRGKPRDNDLLPR